MAVEQGLTPCRRWLKKRPGDRWGCWKGRSGLLILPGLAYDEMKPGSSHLAHREAQRRSPCWEERSLEAPTAGSSGSWCLVCAARHSASAEFSESAELAWLW